MNHRKNRTLYEDDHLLVIDKQSGVLSIPDRYDPSIRNLYGQLQSKYSEIYIVHRLDKETSGVICFARTEEAHRNLNLQFEKRAVSKSYLAIVEGIPDSDNGEIDMPLLYAPQQKKMIVTKAGKSSLTTYKVIEKFRDYSLLEVGIHTGRTHQIRAHLQFIGYPLAVDHTYGNQREFFLSSIKRGYNLAKGKKETALVQRCTLHAACLKITHPETGEALEVHSPLPKDLNAMVNQLRKWNN